MAACHFCFPDLSVGEWVIWTAPQIALLITGNSPDMRHCKCMEGGSTVFVCIDVICLRAREIFLLQNECIPAFMCVYSLGADRFLHAHGGPLSARWMVSAGVREVTAGWPGLSWLRVWILSSDSYWQLPMGDKSTAAPPTPPLMSLHHGKSLFAEKSMMSHSVH